jgi:sarcosine oxidase subunit beta
MPQADVIVIGAGIMGASTAFHLAERGLQVALLEKRFVGAGATGKSSAIIRQHYSNEVTARMALHSLRVFQNFAGAVSGDAGFTQTGFLLLVPAKDRTGLEANIALQQRVGINTRLLAAEELRELEPALEASDLVAAAYEPESGYADPAATLQGYLRRAQDLGTRLYQETEVIGVRFRGGRVEGVDTTHGRFDAPVVVNCAGPWGARVGRMAGVELPINPCRVQVGFFRAPVERERPRAVIGDFVQAIYFRPEAGGLTLVGRIDPAEAEAIVDPDNYDERVDLDFMADVGERLARRYPRFEEGHSHGGYAGLYAITPDWHPVIDEVPPDSGFYVAAGFSGHGFKLGPAVGLMVADLVTGRQSAASLGLAPDLFRADRFSTGDLVRGRYEYSIAG